MQGGDATGPQDPPDRTLALGTLLVSEAPVLPPEQAEEETGELLGPFKLVERLGRGTFGSVWRAVRTVPFEQEVAIKIMRKDVAAAEGPDAIQARFDLERQVLAELEHPGIARVFDGGVSARGRNYFVMELVRGKPITQFCDERQLTIRERLDLFTQVCEAVHYAHQHGVLHRDLKPQNILAFALEGDMAAGSNPLRAKVIDFGLAKVTLKAGTERHQFVERGLVLGTPEYMSPEQAGGEGTVDARSDIYGLGAVLYELLVSAAPFDRAALRSAGLQAMVRMIRDSEPPSPSERLRSMAAAAAAPSVASSIDSISSARRINPRVLLADLRRELDLLPMKAMRRDPSDRYRSAVELADDIRNYLESRPLIAAPPSMLYVARKLARRHRLAVGAVATVAVALVSATVVSTLFFLREQKARQLAEVREGQVRRIADFQSDMLARVDAEQAGLSLSQWMRDRLVQVLSSRGLAAPEAAARSDRLRADLDEVNPTDAVAELVHHAILGPASAQAAAFGDQPTLEAALKQTLSDAYQALGQSERAQPLQADALRIRRRELGPGDPATLQSLAATGVVELDLHGPDAAEAPMLEALEARKRLGASDRTWQDSVTEVARLRAAQGRPQEALDLLEPLLKAGSGVSDDRRMEVLATVGQLQVELGRPEEAVRTLEPLRRTLSSSSTARADLALQVLNNLGVAQERLLNLGRGDDGLRQAAVATRQESLAWHERRFGRDHPYALLARNNLAVLLWKLGRHAESRELADLGLQLATSSSDAVQSVRRWLLNTRANALTDLGKSDEGAHDLDEARALSARLEGPDSESELALRVSQAAMLERAGRAVDAIASWRDIVAAWDRRLASTSAIQDRRGRVDAGFDLGTRLEEAGRWSEAYEALNRGEEAARALPESSQARLRVTRELLTACRRWKQADATAPVDGRIGELEAALPKLQSAFEAKQAKDAGGP